jgi:hypothetical protein
VPWQGIFEQNRDPVNETQPKIRVNGLPRPSATANWAGETQVVDFGLIHGFKAPGGVGILGDLIGVQR